MGKASRKKKLIHEGSADQGKTLKSSITIATPQIKKESQQSSSRTKLLLMIFIILLCSVAVYFNSLYNGFVFDDSFQVLGNRWITDIRYIPDILFKSVWSFQGESSISNYYRPMMHLIYMFNYHIFGLKPWGFHLANILLHAGVSALVFLIFLRFFRISPSSASVSFLAPSFIATLLFATHPIHTEAVTWVAGLTDVSCTFFYLLSFYFYIRATGSTLLIKGTYLLSIASFFLATLCKEIALTLPLILVVYDYALKRDKVPFPSFLKKYIPYLVVAGIYFILRFHALGQFAPQKRHPELHTYQYLINIFPLFMQYLEKLILPLNLNAFHVLHPISSLSEAKGILSLIIAMAFIVLTFIAFRKNKVVFLGLLFITVPLLPVLYIPVLGENTFTERYLYLPSFGFVLLFASLIEWVKGKRPAAVTSLTVVLVVIAGLYSWATVNRNTIWKDNYTFYMDVINKSPNAAMPHYNLGNLFVNKGWIDGAIEQYQTALKLNPYYFSAHNNLGSAFINKGRIDEAIEQFQFALSLNPDSAVAYNNLGKAFIRKGWIAKAIEQIQTALKLNSNYADAHNNLGVAFFKIGEIDKAVEQYQTAIRLNPANSAYHRNLEAVFEKKHSR